MRGGFGSVSRLEFSGTPFVCGKSPWHVSAPGALGLAGGAGVHGVYGVGQSQAAPLDIVSIDKVAHFSVFALLGTLLARTQRPSRWWWGILMASGYGLMDEWRQRAVSSG
ncbi:MAG: VanZ family protein [Candidatus Synoicihabitans palmerolidicus]|nr:VanZ family protein [Candidatus Synoicihabitans palmerolidicus]